MPRLKALSGTAQVQLLHKGAGQPTSLQRKGFLGNECNRLACNLSVQSKRKLSILRLNLHQPMKCSNWC